MAEELKTTPLGIGILIKWEGKMAGFSDRELLYPQMRWACNHGLTQTLFIDAYKKHAHIVRISKENR